jgi:glycosyltransferase involved in cell wall biosynthesis
MKIFIHAPNINIGGGGVLLRSIISSISEGYSCQLHLDSRFRLDCPSSNIETIKWVPPTIFARLKIEYQLYKLVNEGDLVICFGNLPPLFSLSGNVFLVIQNRFLLDKSIPLMFPFRVSLRIYFERILLLLFNRYVDFFVVQTASMKKILIEGDFVHERPVLVTPFLPLITSFNNLSIKKYDFIYPASIDFHKNHKNLIAAWIILANSGLYPSLALTLDPHCESCAWIFSEIKRFSLNVVLLGQLSEDNMLNLYSESRALVYPSILESFGLPLIEASLLGLPIIASDLDYVWDVVEPDLTFNPSNPLSISRAIKKFIGAPHKPFNFMPSKDLIPFFASLLN